MTKRLNDPELIEIFGRQTVLEVMVDKIGEEQERLSKLKNELSSKMACIATRNFPEKWHKTHWEGHLDRHLGQTIRQSEKQLERYAKLYLLCKDKLPKNGLDDCKIEDARNRPIVEFLEGRVRHVGNRSSAPCPFHEDKNPSFVVYDDNSWHCFGCSKHGNNAIDFVMQKDGLSFREAVRAL